MKTTTIHFDLARFGGVDALLNRDQTDQDTEIGTDELASVPSVPRDMGIVNARKSSNEWVSPKEEEITIEVPRDTRDRATQTDRAKPAFRFTTNGLQFGDICSGWTPQAWAVELKRKAECCEEHRPDIADRYRKWATDIETKIRTD